MRAAVRLWCCALTSTNPLAGALTNIAGTKCFPWHQSWRNTNSVWWSFGGRAGSRAYHTPTAPHIPASPAHLPGCSCCSQPASLPQCFLPRRRHGSTSPGARTGGAGGCFSIWRLEEASLTRSNGSHREKTLPTELP